MAEGSIEGSPPIRKPYIISDYRDGTYQPNGSFTREPLLSSQAIDVWNRDNKLFMGKLWGKGQALFFKDKTVPLVFGRSSQACDVKIDADPDSTGFAVYERGVSRRHFELKFIGADRLEIKDLESHNGLRIFNIRDRSRNISLGKEGIVSAQLETGDFVLSGGGEDPEQGGRLIGFTVVRNEEKEMFLVKFNAQNEDDLLAIIGAVKEKPREESFGENEMVRGMLGGLIEDLRGVKKFETQGPNSLEALDQTQKYLTAVLETCRILGVKYFAGDWRMAAGRIGMSALQMAEEALQEGNKPNSARLVEISSFMHQIASGGLFPRVKDE